MPALSGIAANSSRLDMKLLWTGGMSGGEWVPAYQVAVYCDDGQPVVPLLPQDEMVLQANSVASGAATRGGSADASDAFCGSACVFQFENVENNINEISHKIRNQEAIAWDDLHETLLPMDQVLEARKEGSHF